MGKEYIRQVDARLCQMPADNVLVLEDFVTIVNWSSSGTGSDYAITRDTSTYMKSSFGIDTPGSLKIVTRTTTPANGMFAMRFLRGPWGKDKNLFYQGVFAPTPSTGTAPPYGSPATSPMVLMFINPVLPYTRMLM